ncbi:MAG: hypothetical protein ABSE57_28380 [Bryobacteraceae bacterium]|jgi:hypothetical protein
MEADWEFEVDDQAPAIEACWPGFVDLRVHPERAADLPETAQLPGLASALKTLNSQASIVWTSKCDFWPALEQEAFNGDELDAPSESVAHVVGCFIDLLPKRDRAWAFPADAEAECRRLCAVFAAIPMRCCRIDLVVRRAVIIPDRMDLGITAYITACGSTPSEGKAGLEAALAAFAHAFCLGSKLQ